MGVARPSCGCIRVLSSCPGLCPQILRHPRPPGFVSSHLKMDNKKRLAYAIIRFLHDQLRHGGLSPDAQESLEGTCGALPAAPHQELPPAASFCPLLPTPSIHA